MLLLWRNALFDNHVYCGEDKVLELKYFVNTTEECGVSLFVELKLVYLFCVRVGKRDKWREMHKKTG